MSDETIEGYLERLSPLTETPFEKALLAASLKSLQAADNPLRLNNFSCGIRELSRHILKRTAPDNDVAATIWYKNLTGQAGKIARSERAKFAIQKGLPDSYVAQFYDIDSSVKQIIDTIDSLNKYTHVEEDTFGISEEEVALHVDLVLDEFENFTSAIIDFPEAFEQSLENHIDVEIMRHSVSETIETIDRLSTHHTINYTYITDYSIEKIEGNKIQVSVEGSIAVTLQYGSNSDLERGDGAELEDSFPFTCTVEAMLNEQIDENEWTVQDLEVNTDDFYEE